MDACRDGRGRSFVSHVVELAYLKSSGGVTIGKIQIKTLGRAGHRRREPGNWNYCMTGLIDES